MIALCRPHARLPALHRLVNERDQILLVPGKTKDLARAIQGDAQVKLKHAPSVFDVGGRPKLALDYGEGSELLDRAALRVAPEFIELGHDCLPAVLLPSSPEGTLPQGVTKVSLLCCNNGSLSPQSEGADISARLISIGHRADEVRA